MGFERKQFTFYRSFLVIVEQLPVKKQREFLLTLIRYALNETEPTTKDAGVRAAFEGVRPILDRARIKAQAGKNGGSASGEVRENARSKTEAKPKQTEAKPKQDIGGDIGEKDIDIAIALGGKEIEDLASGEALPGPQESEELYQEVFHQLYFYEVPVSAKDREDIISLCEQYGSRAVLDAIYAADQRNVRRWPYIRAIVTSGGVGPRGGQGTGGASRRVRETNAQCQQHGEISPGMLAAAKAMLDEDFGEEWQDGSTDSSLRSE